MARRSKYEYLQVMWLRDSTGGPSDAVGVVGRSDTSVWPSSQGCDRVPEPSDTALAARAPGDPAG